jgi:hypothetical protein
MDSGNTGPKPSYGCVCINEGQVLLIQKNYSIGFRQLWHWRSEDRLKKSFQREVKNNLQDCTPQGTQCFCIFHN